MQLFVRGERALTIGVFVLAMFLGHSSSSFAQETVSEEFLDQYVKLSETWVEYYKSGPDGERDGRSFEKLQDQLADFLSVGLNQHPRAPETKRALEIYSRLAIEEAKGMVVAAGDYSKAIRRLETPLFYYESIDIEVYPPLKTVIAEFKDMQFLSLERFEKIGVGMTQAEVREISGVPYYQNIQIDEQRGVETWIFPKRDGGGATVYFKLDDLKVYDKKFEAIKTQMVD